MESEPGLEALMKAYQGGDPAAVTALVHRLSPQLHRYFLFQAVSRPHADDLLQETWMRVHQARHTYRAGHPVQPWLFAIARHVRIDHYRRSHGSGFREESLEGKEIGASAEVRASAEPDLETMLAPLPESQREVIVMLKVSGMSIEEVARATASSVGSVKQKAHRAYERLRNSLGKSRAREGGAS